MPWQWSPARNHPPPRHILHKDGMELSHWLHPFVRVKSSLWLKIHGPSDRELANKTALGTRYVWTSQRRRGHSSTTTLDPKIRHFYSTLPSSTLAPAPIWGMQHAMQENTSPTQPCERKTGIGARSPLPTPSFLSLCRHVVTLAQTCMPSSRSSPSDGYSTGRRHTPMSPNIWRKGQK